ncbi:hypothetical protein [Brevibacterium sp.]|uniref:hypothetical protein n=1 Tax=Brevibacterium sp. TaxID=1701 RepID=UPI00281266DB|nr:hypothetical protein [Brevibacterium sp.]
MSKFIIRVDRGFKMPGTGFLPATGPFANRVWDIYEQTTPDSPPRYHSFAWTAEQAWDNVKTILRNRAGLVARPDRPYRPMTRETVAGAMGVTKWADALRLANPTVGGHIVGEEDVFTAVRKQRLTDRLVDHTETADVRGHEAAIAAAVDYLDTHDLINYANLGGDLVHGIAEPQEQPC